MVDGVEGSLLLLLALMALAVGIFDRGDRAYPWIAAACLFLGIHRGNQAVMFLGNFETMHGFEFPLGIGLSLSECAYAAFVPLMAALLLRRLGLTLQFHGQGCNAKSAGGVSPAR